MVTKLHSSVVGTSLLALAACALLSGCGGPGPVQVGDAILPVLADGTDPMPEEAKGAPTVEVHKDKPATIPDAKVVKLGIDRKVPWAQVKAILALMKERQQTPVLLVAQRGKARAFHISDKLDGPIIKAYASMEHKLCVSHPDAKEYKCIQGGDKSYIDPAFTRELVREAVNVYERTNVEIRLPDGLKWGDVVSAIGGSRSCCKGKVVRVALKE